MALGFGKGMLAQERGWCRHRQGGQEVLAWAPEYQDLAPWVQPLVTGKLSLRAEGGKAASRGEPAFLLPCTVLCEHRVKQAGFGAVV